MKASTNLTLAVPSREDHKQKSPPNTNLTLAIPSYEDHKLNSSLNTNLTLAVPSYEDHEQNSSLNTNLTLAVATNQDLSGKTTVEAHGEGNITVSLLDKRSRTIQDHDQTSNEDKQNFFSRHEIDTSRRQWEKFFFEKKLTLSDANLHQITIPWRYWKYFPPLEIAINEGTSNWKQIKCIDDGDNKKILPMSFGWHGIRRVIGKGWINFVKRHELKANDVVRFYPEPAEEGKFKFLLKFIRATGTNVTNIEMPNREDDSKVGGSIEQAGDDITAQTRPGGRASGNTDHDQVQGKPNKS
ncbi:hypothetical protein F0562_002279 [Nyssa sinensis]|uniref:TF-B3 domain-containing protein n=1 Tax=Nyssa sinensis TaxID=561372 RepID=A0A5J5C5F2_9ASTE|nr:hypothetical protein F0562_002279 [Nyssa sinensis]